MIISGPVILEIEPFESGLYSQTKRERLYQSSFVVNSSIFHFAPETRLKVLS